MILKRVFKLCIALWSQVTGLKRLAVYTRFQNYATKPENSQIKVAP